MEKKAARPRTPKIAKKPEAQPFITEFDQYLFGQGVHYEIYKKLGAHVAMKRARRVCILPFGHRMPRAYVWSAILTAGIAKRTR